MYIALRACGYRNRPRRCIRDMRKRENTYQVAEKRTKVFGFEVRISQLSLGRVRARERGGRKAMLMLGCDLDRGGFEVQV